MNSKKTRLNTDNVSGFIKVRSSFSRKIVCCYAKNIHNIQSYIIFLNSIKNELTDLLKTFTNNNAIKFNLKLEASYNRLHIENSSVNTAFKTLARAIFVDKNIGEI
jgi:hypothetical protein